MESIGTGGTEKVAESYFEAADIATRFDQRVEGEKDFTL